MLEKRLPRRKTLGGSIPIRRQVPSSDQGQQIQDSLRQYRGLRIKSDREYALTHELIQVTASGLTSLANDAIIAMSGGERFVERPRTAASISNRGRTAFFDNHQDQGFPVGATAISYLEFRN